MIQTCTYCQKNFKFLRGHYEYCKLNPQRKDRSGSNNPNFGNKEKANNQYTKAKKMNIEYIPTEKEIEGRKRNSIARNKKRWESPGARERQSLAIKAAIERNPEAYSSSNVSGRAKLYDATDSLGNKCKVKGRWELLVSEWLTEQRIRWIIPKDGFKYEFNGIRTYFPDFYLIDENRYIEVKGFERDTDRIKWKSVDNLILLKKEEINSIKKKILIFANVV